MIKNKRILLIISGGIAAYKSLELIRLFKKSGVQLKCILTQGGSNFVTPLSISALAESEVYTDLWSLKDENEMGHIRLSREADLIVVAPASANLIAQMAHGLAEDLASTTLLASNRPILICPAMNPMMWQNQATQDNLSLLKKRGVHVLNPAEGDMACGETGVGRMPEAQDIFNYIDTYFESNKPLAGKQVLVTSGPTYEPIDPVRFIGNRSSGKQGNAIAMALIDAGASVTYIAGPTDLPEPKGAETVHVETADQMLDAVQSLENIDIAICAAAVSDWKAVQIEPQKMKKEKDKDRLTIELIKNPDILHMIATSKTRPTLVIGFAAETENVIENAKTKLQSKQCDWIIANDVGDKKVFGRDQNQVTIVKKDSQVVLNLADKSIIARDIVSEIIQYYVSNNKN